MAKRVKKSKNLLEKALDTLVTSQDIDTQQKLQEIDSAFMVESNEEKPKQNLHKKFHKFL